MTEIYYTNSQSETQTLGAAIAPRFKPGDTVAFFGMLGAGKTAFVRGILRGLGITQAVTSPTFTIVNEYRGDILNAAHFDMYRIATEEDLFSTGFYDYLDGGWLVLMEWSEHVAWVIEPETIRIVMEGSGGEPRKITIEGLRI